ncbi:MAG: radical SAM protein [Lachnospiraceae bacterium]|nr:radical SAM protein [Lachnospiraceae bacterium]
MNEYLRNVNRIEFVVTMACTGRCKHCSEGEHISHGEHIDESLAVQAIYDICANYNIQSLMTFGGEPLLYPEVVCKIHEAATKMNIPQRDLITNGFFSKDESRIKEVAHMLAQSGVGNIALSVDAFHQETIPLEPVKFFAKCVQQEKIALKVHPAWLVSKTDDNPYNLRTREILQEFEQMDIYASNGNIIFPSGNARKYLSEYFDPAEEYVNPYDDDPKDVRSICFSPNGDVLHGNINNKCIMDILNSYSVSND